MPQAPQFTSNILTQFDVEPNHAVAAVAPAPSASIQTPPAAAPVLEPIAEAFVAPEDFGGELNLNGSAAAVAAETAQGKPLPRDILLAKARQYRETQTVRSRTPQPEQLSMDMENSENSLEMARRLANEIVKSPFDSKNLDIPAFLRRKSTRTEEELG